jgi:hypothetical protein
MVYAACSDFCSDDIVPLVRAMKKGPGTFARGLVLLAGQHFFLPPLPVFFLPAI